MRFTAGRGQLLAACRRGRLRSNVALARATPFILLLAGTHLAAPSAVSVGLPARGPAIERLEVTPASLKLDGPDAAHGILVTGFTRDGHPLDLTREARYKANTSSLTVGSNGLCVAWADGSAEIQIEAAGKIIRVPVEIVGSASPRRISFRHDIEPILTRAGCNMGACHGKLAGQNGFKLSLRGYAPEQDIVSLTTDLTGRRINPAFPDESLLLLKALGRVPHEGQQRFAEGSRAHQTLADWIGARAPGPLTNEAEVIRLELLPGPRSYQVGDAQQLLARASYADGRVRDVTWLAQFFSNDENTASVSPDGLVRALRPGETSVRAHFQGLVETLTVSIPYANEVRPRELARRRRVSPGSQSIDDAVFAKLAALRIPPSANSDDATFLRRAYLDVTGTLPTPEEVRAFSRERRRDKRARLIERLLQSPEYIDYWTLQLADLLQNRRERYHDVRGTKGVRAFHQWLRGEVAANRPWNELAREILTARGAVSDHPEVGYFIYNVGEKSRVEESDTPDAVAQAFLGTRIGCARCHNHPLEKYTQDDFYHFAAFFSKVQMKRSDPEKGPTQLNVATREEEEQRKRLAEAEKALFDATNVVARAQLDGVSPADLEKARKKLAEQEKRYEEARLQLARASLRMPTVTQPRTKQSMAPRPLDRAPLDFVPGHDPREQLVDWMMNPANPYFSGAMVSRLWKHFLGVGLVEPVDDLRASNPPSNPALWQVLNTEFVRSGFDLRHVMRLILNSRTYQLSAATRPGNETDQRFYSHYFARRLPAEVMLDAIARATGVPDDFKGYPVGTRAIQLPEPGISSYFLTLFGRSDRVTACACERQGEVTLPQLLHLQNGDATVKKIASDQNRLSQMLRSSASAEAIVEELFLATLSRRPSKAEMASVQAALRTGERTEAFQDLFWALLNSKEFAFNH
jgi:hypothetical protein